MDLLAILMTGLFAGGLTCLAVQGGLLASSVAAQERRELESSSHTTSVLSFLIARLLAYTALGFILGALGSVAQLSLWLRALLQFLISLFMIGTALNLLQVHPFFRYFVIQPPKFLTRLVKNQAHSQSVFGPGLLGAFTVFIPCGVTQAMMAYAMSTASAWSGALTMFTFILGTSPLFFLVGYATGRLSQEANSRMTRLVSVAILLIAIYNLSGALALSGFTLKLPAFASSRSSTSQQVAPVTQATIYLTQSGYQSEPSTLVVEGGSTMQLTLTNRGAQGCIQSFTIPKLGVQQLISIGSTKTITLKVPLVSGEIPFMCSMGMYRGVIYVK